MKSLSLALLMMCLVNVPTFAYEGTRLVQSIPNYSSCFVEDPTNTPLKYRSAPYGKVLGTLKNGTSIFIADTPIKTDKNGKMWGKAYWLDDGDYNSSNLNYLGWVYLEYVSCDA